MSLRQPIRIVVQNSLEFAGVPSTTAEIIDVDRHAAEKFHGMTRDFGDRENSRVRDLVDLVILIEHQLLHIHELRVHINSVWRERNNESPLDTPGISGNLACAI